MSLTKKNSLKIYPLNWLKILFILCILFYHSWETLFGASTEGQRLFPFYEYSSHFFVQSAGHMGLGIVMISFFLWGYRSLKISLYKWIFLLGGSFTLSSSHNIQGSPLENLVWNLYLFLLVTLGIVVILKKLKIPSIILCGISLIGLLIPVDLYQKIGFLNSSENLKFVFYGGIENDFVGWGLLPWGFLPIFANSMGDFFRVLDNKLKKTNILELFFWIAAIGIGFLFQNEVLSYPETPQEYYKFVFWDKYHFFLPRFLILIFFIRLSFLEIKFTFLNFILSFNKLISELQWSKNLVLCYFTHFIILSLFISARDWFVQHKIIFQFLGFFIFIVTELIIQIFIKTLNGINFSHKN